MIKIVACLLVTLALGIVLIIDVVSIAPTWTVYIELLGLALAFIAAILYFMSWSKRKKHRGKANIENRAVQTKKHHRHKGRGMGHDNFAH